jgi:hypothetical protein
MVLRGPSLLTLVLTRFCTSERTEMSAGTKRADRPRWVISWTTAWASEAWAGMSFTQMS